MWQKNIASFPNIPALVGLLNMTSNSLPLLLFSSLFSPLVLGYYFLAHRSISLPLSFVGNAFSQVFFQKASEYHQESRDIKGLVWRSYKSLFLIAIIPALILFIFSPVIFSTIFGKEWRVAGEYCRLLIPWLTLMFIVSPSTNIFQVLDKQEQALLFEVMVFVTRLLAILIGAFIFNNPFYAIGLYGLSGLIVNLVMAMRIITISSGGIIKENYA